MGLDITKDDIAEFKKFLREHPIDPAYDEEMEKLDGNVPIEQLAARNCYEILRLIGEIKE